MSEVQTTGQFTVGEWRVDPNLGRISRNGDVRVIEPRIMDLLVFLADRAGETVSTDELAQTVWSGRAITDQPVYQGVAQLRKALQDEARQPRYIATVTKKGYRLIAPVIVLAPSNEKIPAKTTLAPRSRYMAPALSLILAGTYLFFSSSDVSVSGERHTPYQDALGSIAILPFVDMSADGSQQYLGDGIAEELIHRIAAVPGLKVVARTSAFSLRDSGLDAQAIGGRLGADAILEGSVRLYGERLRVTAQLVDAASGYHLWSETYEPLSGDVLTIQDQIARSVIQQLKSGQDGDSTQRYWTQNADAADAYYLGMFHLEKRHIDSYDRALAYFQQAVVDDPQFALAYVGLANTWSNGSERRWGRFPQEDAEHNSENALRIAEALDANLSEVLVIRATEAMRAGDYLRAEELCLRAIEANRNDSEAWFRYGRLLLELGRPQSALTAQRNALQLDPLRPRWRAVIADNYYMLNMLEDAERELLTAIELDPEWLAAYASLGALLTDSGQLARAIDYGKKGHYAEGGNENWARFTALGIGYVYITLGDFATADRWFAKAESQEEDWFAVNIHLHRLLAEDRYSEADSLLDDWVEKHPDIDTIMNLGGLYRSMMGQDESALGLFEHALALPSEGDYSNLFRLDFLNWGFVGAVHLARLYSLAGETDNAHELLVQSERFIEENSFGMEYSAGAKYVLASIHALRREDRQALRALSDAFESGWVMRWFVQRDPVFGRFHGDPEFMSILDRMSDYLEAQRLELARLEEDGSVAGPQSE